MGKSTKHRPGVVGEALLRARRAARLTQEKLAERAGLNRVTVAEIETGITGAPDFGTIEKLARALDLKTGDLMGGSTATPAANHGRSDLSDILPPSLQTYLERHGDEVTHKEAQLAARLGFKLDDEAPELDPETFWGGIFETIRKSRKSPGTR